jgi:hypothetical protein
MIFTVLAAAALLNVSNPADNRDVQIYGIGSDTCVNWKSDPRREREGDAWLLGYWSGLNRINSVNGLVGAKAGGEGVIAAVSRVCGRNPGATLEDATYGAYALMQTSGQ